MQRHAPVQQPSLLQFGASFAHWVGAAVAILRRSQATAPSVPTSERKNRARHICKDAVRQSLESLNCHVESKKTDKKRFKVTPCSVKYYDIQSRSHMAELHICTVSAYAKMKPQK